LSRADFIRDLTNIGKYAFYMSKIDYDWSTLNGCTFDTNATSLQLNPTDFWSSCTFTPCENLIPTRFSQYDPRWVDRIFATRDSGGKTFTYSQGCQWMCAMHIYCGINNIVLESPIEFENIVDNINPAVRNTFESNQTYFANLMRNLGLTATLYTSSNQTSLQDLYNAVSGGGYACIEVGSGAKTTGHTIVVYGVNDKGELLVLNSSSDTYDDRGKYMMLSIPYQNIVAPDSKLVIVTP
jgi:hypothetical protein